MPKISISSFPAIIDFCWYALVRGFSGVVNWRRRRKKSAGRRKDGRAARLFPAKTQETGYTHGVAAEPTTKHSRCLRERERERERASYPVFGIISLALEQIRALCGGFRDWGDCLWVERGRRGELKGDARVAIQRKPDIYDRH